jgi:hypothetical protein
MFSYQNSLVGDGTDPMRILNQTQGRLAELSAGANAGFDPAMRQQAKSKCEAEAGTLYAIVGSRGGLIEIRPVAPTKAANTHPRLVMTVASGEFGVGIDASITVRSEA